MYMSQKMRGNVSTLQGGTIKTGPSLVRNVPNISRGTKVTYFKFRGTNND